MKIMNDLFCYLMWACFFVFSMFFECKAQFLDNDKKGVSDETFLESRGVSLDVQSLINLATNLNKNTERLVAVKVLGKRNDKPGNDYWKHIINTDPSSLARIEAAKILGTNDVVFSKKTLRHELGLHIPLIFKISAAGYLAQLQDDSGYSIVCSVLTNEYSATPDAYRAVRVIGAFTSLGKDISVPLMAGLERRLSNSTAKKEDFIYKTQVRDICEALAYTGNTNTSKRLLFLAASQPLEIRAEIEKAIKNNKGRDTMKRDIDIAKP